jgi:hypothetical protein
MEWHHRGVPFLTTPCWMCVHSRRQLSPKSGEATGSTRPASADAEFRRSAQGPSTPTHYSEKILLVLPGEEGAELGAGAPSEEGFSLGVSPRGGRRGSLFMDRLVMTEELREDLHAASGVSDSAQKKVNHREFLERQRAKEAQKQENLQRIKSYVDRYICRLIRSLCHASPVRVCCVCLFCFVLFCFAPMCA